jgi:hypothetical protein
VGGVTELLVHSAPFHCRALPFSSTPMQNVDELHEIDWMSLKPDVSTMVGEDQDVPFQRNTCPTASPAMQKVEVEHDTERSAFPWSMLVADDHVDPFQVSALPDPSTAAQNEAEAQETPFSCCDPSMSETSFDHEVPFHVTAPPDAPTATQNVVEGQDTEPKPWLMFCEGSAEDGADHTNGALDAVVALAGSGISANKPVAVILNAATAQPQRRDRARYLMCHSSVSLTRRIPLRAPMQPECNSGGDHVNGPIQCLVEWPVRANHFNAPGFYVVQRERAASTDGCL